jgi:hypothetical protein
VHGVDRGWDVCHDAEPAPGVRVANTKVSYYEAQLRQTMDNVSAMLPPEKVAAVWIRNVPGLSASPLLGFVRDVLKSSTTTDAPPQISQLILEICDLLVGAIKPTETLSDI